MNLKFGAGKGRSQGHALISDAWNDYISHMLLHYSEVCILHLYNINFLPVTEMEESENKY